MTTKLKLEFAREGQLIFNFKLTEMEPTPPSSHEKQHYPGQEKAVDAISPRCASLAAQVKYITFYLNLSDRYMFTNDDFRVDWGEVWRTTRKVTPEEWDALRATATNEYDRSVGQQSPAGA